MNGLLIKTVRLSLGLSQGALADQLDISRSYLSLVEGGRAKPSLTLLERAAKALEVPLPLLVLRHGDSLVEPKIYDQLSKILTDIILAKTGSQGRARNGRNQKRKTPRNPKS